MSVGYQDNFLLGAPKPLDDRYGPWPLLDGITGPKLNIPLSFRFKGLTVAVVDGTGVKEYWWKDGITDTDLVVKSSTGGGTVTQGNGIIVTTTTSATTIEVDTNIVQLKSLLSNSFTADGANTSKYPSVKAVKDYVDANITGLLNDRGSYNPTVTSAYPTSANGGSGTAGAVMKGDIWFINTPGSMGGLSVPKGASVRALVNSPGQTAANWDVLDIGLGYIAEDAANRVETLADFNNNLTSIDMYPSINAIKLYLDGIGAGTIPGLDTVLQTGSTGTDKNITLTTTSSSTDNLLTLENTFSGSLKKSVLSASNLSVFNTATQKATYGYNSVTFTDAVGAVATLNVTPANQTLAFPSASGTLARIEDISSNLTGFLTQTTADTLYQPLDSDLTAIAALTGDGILVRNTNNTWSLDTTGYIKKTAVNTSKSGLKYDTGADTLYALYNTEIPDAVTNVAVGSLPAGFATAATWKTKRIVEVLDDILFPTINPTYVAPTYTLSSSVGLVKIGATGIRPTITGTFNKGSIRIGSTFQNFRSGDASSYDFSGPGSFSSNTSGTGTASGANYVASASYGVDLTIVQGLMTFSSTVNYTVGPQPKDSRGANSGSPLSAGSLTATATLEGVYPIYATTSNIAVLTEQALVSMISGNNIEYTLAAESGSNKQTFSIPTVWITARPLTAVQYFNTVSNSFDPTNKISDFTVTNTTISSVNYKQYQYNGALRGAIKVKLIF